jgi:hypothetical protein
MVGGVADSVPPHSGVADMEGTVTIEGTGSVKPTPVRGVVAFGLLMVKVSVEVAPTAIEDGLKIFVIVGGPTTVIVAVPVGPFRTSWIVLVKEPGVPPPVTVTLNVQVPLPATVAPTSVMVVDVADSVPPHSGVAAMGVTVTPGGVSMKPTPGAGVAFGLVMVKVNVEVAPSATVDGLYDLPGCSGWSTVTVI